MRARRRCSLLDNQGSYTETFGVAVLMFDQVIFALSNRCIARLLSRKYS